MISILMGVMAVYFCMMGMGAKVQDMSLKVDRKRKEDPQCVINRS